MNTMNKRVALCNQLNMNFEEANELFDNESLESMQMAKVNGGSPVLIPIGAKAIFEIIVGVCGVISCVYTIVSQSTKAPQDPPRETTSTQNLEKMVSTMVNSGKPVTLEIDSIVDNNIYGLKFKINGPTKGQ